MQRTVLKGRRIVEGQCKANALVSTKPISFLGGVDSTDGRVVDKTSDLYGKCVKDTVLCFPHGRGSTVGSYVLYSLAKRKLAPKAILNQTADPVIVVGAIIANIPMIDGVDISRICNGDLVEVNADKGSVKVFKQKES
jgi:phosphomecalonate degydratase small subunit